MLREFDDGFQFDNWADCIKDLKARYRRTHPGETEALHYQFSESCLENGKSGFLKVERLEAPETGPTPQTETVLIENNRVVAHQTEDTPAEGIELWRWLE